MKFCTWLSGFSGLPQKYFVGRIPSFVMNILEKGVLAESQEVLFSSV